MIFDSTAVINILISKKLNYRWIKPYRITKSDLFKGIYKISELGNAILRDTYADNKLKRFYAAVVLDIFRRYRTPAPFDDRDHDIINFADAF